MNSILKQNFSRSCKTWLVTGCAGFIGSNLIEFLLNAGQKVVGIDNFSTGYQHNIDNVLESVGAQKDNFTFYEGCITNLEFCRKACKGVDYVLHQAALGSVPRSIDIPYMTDLMNVNGFVVLLTACRDEGVKKIVYASSSSVYGDDSSPSKIEEQRGTVLSPYAVSKLTCEHYAEVFSSLFDMTCIGLRYFNVFGPRQDPSGAYAAVIPRWILALKKGEPCTIFGDGLTSRDFSYIDNVVQANCLAAIVPQEDLPTGPAVFNVACGDSTSLNDLYSAIAQRVAKITNEAFTEAQYADFRKGDIRHSLADISRAKESLRYAPTVSVEEGIKRTVEWFFEAHNENS